MKSFLNLLPHLFLFYFSFQITLVIAQSDKQNIAGEYSLQEVHEMASGFLFKEDSTFQFYYTYGASDRSAHGTYSVESNRVILHGTKLPGKDFQLTEQKKSGKGFTVSIANENKMLVAHVVCLFIGNKDTIEVETNSEGIANAEITDCKKIQLIHTYFPDEPTVLELNNNSNNFFEFTLNPSLSEVVFNISILEIENNSFKCSNIYLFGADKVRFAKQ